MMFVGLYNLLKEKINISYEIMKMNKLFITILLLLTIYSISSIKTQQSQQQQGTRVIFYIQKEIQQPEDYVEINIEIKAQDQKLEKAINEAKSIVDQVQSIVKKYCESNSKNKKDCEGVVQTSEYQIDPIYQLVRKVPTFVAFSVVHQTVAKIREVKNIGKLADDILKSGVSKINSFEWKPLEQVDNEQQAVTEGIELVNSICSQIGLQLGRIVAVSQVNDYEEDEEEEPAQEGAEQEEEPEQQSEEEQQPTIVYRFEIICQAKGNKPKK